MQSILASSLKSKGMQRLLIQSSKYFGVKKSIYNRKLKLSKNLLDEGITSDNTIDVTHSYSEHDEYD